jgi:hypothetical protein
MEPQVQDTFLQVVKAMDGFNKAIESWIRGLDQAGADPDHVARLTTAAKAMKDSSWIYLSWAQHLANGLPGEPKEAEAPDIR